MEPQAAQGLGPEDYPSSTDHEAHSQPHHRCGEAEEQQDGVTVEPSVHGQKPARRCV